MLASVTMCFVTMATPVHRKLHYVFRCKILVQVVVHVQYHMNVIYSLGSGHAHTQTYQFHGQKQFQETRRMPAFGQRAPGLKTH